MANNNRRGGRRNQYVAQGADQFVQQFKNEVAAELGIPNYDQIDKGALPSRVNGMIGGTMTKRFVEIAQQVLSGQNPQLSRLNPQQFVQDMQKDMVTGAPLAYSVAQIVPTPEQAAAVQQAALQAAATAQPTTAMPAMPSAASIGPVNTVADGTAAMVSLGQQQSSGQQQNIGTMVPMTQPANNVEAALAMAPRAVDGVASATAPAIDGSSVAPAALARPMVDGASTIQQVASRAGTTLPAPIQTTGNILQ